MKHNAKLFSNCFLSEVMAELKANKQRVGVDRDGIRFAPTSGDYQCCFE